MSTQIEPPASGDLILSVRFTGRDPQREERCGHDGSRRYDERGGWSFDNNELLEIPSGTTSALRAHLPADQVTRRLFFTARSWHVNLDAAVSVTFETAGSEAYAGLQVRDSRYLFIAADGRYAIVSRPLSVVIEESGMWDIPWQSGVALARGIGQPNRLRAVMRETATSFFINDQLVASLEEYRGLSNIGWISVVACSGGQECSILLDNIELRDPIVQAPFAGAPVTLEVCVTDALTNESGAPSGEAHWTFYLQTPSQWAAAPDLNERVFKVTRRLYEDFNRQGQEQADGARYILRATEAHALDAKQEARQPWTRRGMTLYVLKPDETVEKSQS